MTDSQTNPPADPNAATDTDSKSDDDREKSFWDKLGKTIDERIEAGFKKEAANRTRNAPSGTSRGTSRRTLPDMIADIMWPKREE